MPPRIRVVYAAMTFSVFLIAGIPLLRELTRPSGIWWTPPTMMVPLARSADRVEIYARGKPLGTLLAGGGLQLVDGGQTRLLAPDDVALRFNNWDRVRADRLPWLLVDAAACGMMAVLFLLVATGRLAWRGPI